MQQVKLEIVITDIADNEPDNAQENVAGISAACLDLIEAGYEHGEMTADGHKVRWHVQVERLK